MKPINNRRTLLTAGIASLLSPVLRPVLAASPSTSNSPAQPARISHASSYQLQFSSMKPVVMSSLNPLQRAAYAPFQGILDGLAAKDHDAVREHLLPGGMATLIRDGQIVQLHFDAFVARLPTTGVGELKEVIHEAVVHVDENIAVIWAPYSVLVDGMLHHSGTNIVSVVLHDSRWLISNIADNSRAASS